MSRHDVVIIGGGLGGLACGAILSREGMDVCVLEQNNVIGGCFQSFTRRGRTLDTGIHYIGSMAPGQVLNQYFHYFGIMDRIRVQPMSAEGFDVVSIQGREYPLPVGYGPFAEYLAERFPSEKGGIERYCATLREIGATIGVETLAKGKLSENGMRFLGRAASDMVRECFTDRELQSIIAGNSSLYHGIDGVTSLYHFGMVNHSFIEGPYRIAGGTQHVADAFTDTIRANGGTVLTGRKAMAISLEGGNIGWVETADGEKFHARHFISAIHPSATFSMLGKTPLVRKAYRTRINSLKNSYGIFSAYLLMKPGMFPYLGHNYYFCRDGNTWDTDFDTADDSPRTVLMSMQAGFTGMEHAEVVNLLTPMDVSLFAQWEDTLPERRGDEYKEFKSRIAAKMMDIAEERFPGVSGCVEHIYTASPLTYRDYTGIPGGSAYGIIKDCRSPLTTLVPVRTKIPNLLLTGQNMNVHGALGVTVTAALTCAELIGEEYLAKKIAGC